MTAYTEILIRADALARDGITAGQLIKLYLMRLTWTQILRWFILQDTWKSHFQVLKGAK